MRTIRTLLAFGVTLVAFALAIPVLLLGVPFWGVAFLTRRIAHVVEPRFVSLRQIIEFDPTIGWKPKADLDTYYLSERDDIYHVSTDAQGWPGMHTLDESQVVVFGDSFAFGYGVNAAKSYREIVLDVRIKAIAAPGYNLVQQILLMRRFAPHLRGKLTVCFVYFGNDLYDNLSPSTGGYRTPFVRETVGRSGWEIVSSHLSPRTWSYSSGYQRMWAHVLASLHSPTFLSRRAFSACDFLIQEARAVCVSAGAQLVILTIPTPFTLSPAGLAHLAKHSENPHLISADLPDEEIGKICRKHDVPLVAGKRFLGAHHYKRTDDHWNERGHRRVAQLLSRLYQDYVAGKMRSSDAADNAFEKALNDGADG